MSLGEIATRPAREVLDLRFDRALPTAFAICAFAALWLLGRRYQGIIHDATLYVTMGLNRLDPNAFARDLFFVNGSQDSYSVFSPLYAPLIALLGPGDAALLMVVIGQAAFIGAAWALVGRLAPGTRWWALVVLAALAGHYGGGGAVRIAEPFATARTLAEPLVLATLAALLAGRAPLALAALAAASLLHPLVALPAWAVLAVWYAQGRPALLKALPLAFVAACAVLLALPPRLDPAWYASLVERSRHLFILHWQLADFAKVLWAAGMCALAIAFAAAPARRLLVAVTVVALGGVTASFLLVDVGRSGPAAALQFWRALWLLQVFATLVVPFVAIRLWGGGAAHRLAAGLAAASCCFGRAEQTLAAMLVLGALALVLGTRLSAHVDERRMRIGLVIAACLAAVGMLYDIQRRLPDLYIPPESEVWRAYLRVVSSFGVLLPLAVLLGFGMQSRLRRAACGAAVVLLAFAVMIWDARSPWSRYIELRSPHPFAAVIPEGAQVFWSAMSSPAWTSLRTTNWFSADQGAGIVFTRATAIEWPQREMASRALREATAMCDIGRGDCTLAAAPARALCRFPQGPDYLVLSGGVEGWRALAEDAWAPGRVLRLYACRDAA
ncbi:MAG TPA: hypothetical protein VG873_01725 [Burkholderiales bacterium]|nr:hypothetical protein [Burkholderiales bacterium]